MKESSGTEVLDELLLRFRTRIEDETQTLIHLGLPPESTEKVLMNRISSSTETETESSGFGSTSESSGSTISEEDITRTIVRGRMRKEEARRALVIEREIRSMESKGMDLTEALENIISKLGHPRPTVVDELRKALIDGLHTAQSGSEEFSFEENNLNAASLQKSLDSNSKNSPSSGSPLRLVQSSNQKACNVSFNDEERTKNAIR